MNSTGDIDQSFNVKVQGEQETPLQGVNCSLQNFSLMTLLTREIVEKFEEEKNC